MYKGTCPYKRKRVFSSVHVRVCCSFANLQSSLQSLTSSLHPGLTVILFNSYEKLMSRFQEAIPPKKGIK